MCYYQGTFVGSQCRMAAQVWDTRPILLIRIASYPEDKTSSWLAPLLKARIDSILVAVAMVVLPASTSASLKHNSHMDQSTKDGLYKHRATRVKNWLRDHSDSRVVVIYDGIGDPNGCLGGHPHDQRPFIVKPEDVGSDSGHSLPRTNAPVRQHLCNALGDVLYADVVKRWCLMLFMLQSGSKEFTAGTISRCQTDQPYADAYEQPHAITNIIHA